MQAKSLKANSSNEIKTSLEQAGQGTGSGLSLSYDIIKAHGGELRVETEEGKGSVFIIDLTI